MLDREEAFKFGFLSRCAEEGHTSPEAIYARVKVALDLFRTTLYKTAGLIDMPGKILDTAVSAGKASLPLLLAAPPILGAAAGFGLAKATDINDDDVDSIKKRELIDELQQQTERLQRERQSQERQAANAPPRRQIYL